MQSSFFVLFYGNLIRETIMSDKPIWIEKFERPAGTEIKHIGNHWYLYERLSVYDKVRKRKRKKSGRCLGAITEAGLSPSRRTAVSPAGGAGNVSYGNPILLDCRDSIVYQAAADDKAVAVVGADNLVVVVTDDAVLVMPRDRCEDVKRVVAELKRQKRGQI